MLELRAKSLSSAMGVGGGGSGGAIAPQIFDILDFRARMHGHALLSWLLSRTFFVTQNSSVVEEYTKTTSFFPHVCNLYSDVYNYRLYLLIEHMHTRRR